MLSFVDKQFSESSNWMQDLGYASQEVLLADKQNGILWNSNKPASQTKVVSH